MRIDQNPLFRKIIIPWYDSKTACKIMITIMLGILLFGLIGISAATSNELYNDYIWAPVFLTIASAVLLVAAVIRLVKQY